MAIDPLAPEPASESEPAPAPAPTPAPVDVAKSAALSAIDALVAQRERAESEHEAMLVSLLTIASALNCPPSKQACVDKVVELYQEVGRLQNALAALTAPADAPAPLPALP